MPATAFDPEVVRRFEHARWESAARVYEATFAGATAPFVEPLLDAARVGHGTRLLDIASGTGAVALRGAARGAVPTGADFSPAMLAVARARAPGVRFDEADAEALPYPDGTFDAAVAGFGIHHVPRPLFALREAYRVMRSGGHVAFSFWAEPGANIAWKLVFDAVARHRDRAATDAPPSGGGFGSAERCAAALRAAGFTDCATWHEHATWQHRDAAALVSALCAGTARMAAMLEAQRPEALAAIIADIAECAECYRDDAGIALPVAAVIATGVKP